MSTNPIKPPNLFDLATKELSQDAFLTWLLLWANPELSTINKNLHSTAVRFVESLIKLKYKDFDEEIETIIAKRQRDNIDIWALVNTKYLIIIEDKTFSKEHNNQLEIYKKKVQNWKEVKNSSCQIIAVYLKTGNESERDLSIIKQKEYAVFGRTELLNVLSNGENVKNDIFQDYLERLKKLDTLFNQWGDKKIKDWKSNDWQGFFQKIEKRTELKNWHFVNNAKGGFWNAILTWGDWEGYPFYLQIESGDICFKISMVGQDKKIVPKTEWSRLRNELSKLILNKAKLSDANLNIRRPKRFGKGKTMTVACVDQKNWMGNIDDCIKIDNALHSIELIKKFKQEIKSNND
jgi:hypothetical protein